MLNNAIAREMGVSIQYMWQYVQVMGVKSVAVKIAERLWYLGETPLTKPVPVNVGRNLKEFLEIDNDSFYFQGNIRK